jgi:hypothetical protein
VPFSSGSSQPVMTIELVCHVPTSGVRKSSSSLLQPKNNKMQMPKNSVDNLVIIIKFMFEQALNVQNISFWQVACGHFTNLPIERQAEYRHFIMNLSVAERYLSHRL